MENNEGYTIFQPVGINIDYIHVDLSKKQVTATISYQHQVKMTVITDFITGQMHKEGDLIEILAALPSKDEESYFDEIYDWSKTFVENGINDPKKYFEQFE
ncbi:hypothetical protein [Planococcus sp. CAU13]|uniref:hypothetical protein n=1 Tax=Planococcus sp. CAU13 TaxID=1541197 RepID=UPI00052FF03E|nr:hypothetical protein [Planococcus sp. CAU13]